MGLFNKSMSAAELVTTKGGDEGLTSDYSGNRVKKYSERMELIGSLDELNSQIGFLRSLIVEEDPLDVLGTYKNDLIVMLRTVQVTIMDISSLVATDKDSELFGSLRSVTEDNVLELEKWNNEIDCKIESAFIVPGDVSCENEDTGSWITYFDVVRAKSRQCERQFFKFLNESKSSVFHLLPSSKYLNRLSDYLFIEARNLEQNGV